MAIVDVIQHTILSVYRLFGRLISHLSNQNPLPNTIQVETIETPKTIYGKLQNPAGCQGIIEVVLNGIQEPEIDPNYQAPFLCLENLDGVTIESGLIDNPTNYTFLWENGETTTPNGWKD